METRPCMGGDVPQPILFQRESLKLCSVIYGYKYTVHKLFFWLAGRAGFEVLVGLHDGNLCDRPCRLEPRGFDFAGEYGISDIIAPIKAANDHISFAGGLERRHGPHGHRVIAADYALDVGVSLKNRLHN